MATILDGLSELLSSTATRDIGKAVGLEPDLVSKGMAVVGPLLTTALAGKASNAGGLAQLMQLLPKDGLGSILGNLANVARGGSSTDLLSAAFGGGSSAIAGTLDRALGFKASSLLNIAAPLVLGLISKISAEKKMDASNIATLLTKDAEDFQKTGGEQARLVREAIDAGQAATELKAKYSPVQWDSVRYAPVAAAHIVIMADKSGPVGAIKEMRAATVAIDDARKGASPTSLVSLAFDSDFSADELTKFVKGRTPADALATVREAMEVVEHNSPVDAPQYRRLLADVATGVANASKEGGFLGFGGTLVSAAEQAALDQLRAAIGDR